MSGKSNIPADVQKQIAAEYAAGRRSGELSALFGVNRKTVTTIARRCGVEVLDQAEASGRRKESVSPFLTEVIRLRRQGLSQQEIGKAVGKSQIMISRALRSAGMPSAMRPSGARHGSWKGGVTTNGHGYKQEMVSLDDPMASMRNSGGYVAQHRLVMARAIGRPLSNSETVHHINGDKGDNRLQNLQLRQGQHGNGVVMRCACCGSENVVASVIREAA